jgi:hypothetical protein
LEGILESELGGKLGDVGLEGRLKAGKDIGSHAEEARRNVQMDCRKYSSGAQESPPERLSEEQVEQKVRRAVALEILLHEADPTFPNSRRSSEAHVAG